MFERAELKANAKMALKHFYLWGLIACFIYSVISGQFVGWWDSFRRISSLFRGDFYQFLYYGQNMKYAFYELLNPYVITPTAVFSILFGIVIAIVRWIVRVLFLIFVVHVVEIGLYSFFLKNRHQETNLSEMLTPFQNHYMNVVKVTFLRSLYILFWTLLFVIPGIIKSYEYYFVPYLMAENPMMSDEEAFACSRRMTDGEKWNLFIFDLSFIGWILLGGILGGVGSVLVAPYIYASRSELYVCLKERKL